MKASLPVSIRSYEDSVGSAPPRYHGFDYLRAFLPLAVVAWHVPLLKTPALADAPVQDRCLAILVQFANYNLLLLAVPVFFLMALFLFAVRASSDVGYIRRRIKRLAGLYLLWTALWSLVWVAAFGFQSLFKKLAEGWVFFAVSGGYSLFYFFFALLVTTCAVYAALRLPPGVIWSLLIISAAFLVGAPFWVQARPAWQKITAYWNPLNFLPFVFIAVLLKQYTLNGRYLALRAAVPGLLRVLVPLFGAACAGEWYLLAADKGSRLYDGGYVLPPYTRMSVLLGATAIFLAALRVQRPPAAWIRVLSYYALSLYCLHGFVALAYLLLIGRGGRWYATGVEFLLVIALSLLCAVCFGSLQDRLRSLRKRCQPSAKASN